MNYLDDPEKSIELDGRVFPADGVSWTEEDSIRIERMQGLYEAPGDVQMCPGGCGIQIAVPSTDNALSRYGHGEICGTCGTREAFSGDFIKASLDAGV